MISLSDLLALPKGANIAYKRQRWELVQHHVVGSIKEPVFLSENGEYLYESIFIPHLITLIEEK